MKNHSLSLSSWGPYTKKYAGLSHVPDEQAGLRFDLSVFPSFYRRRVDLPNVMWESGYHVWEAAADLSFFTYRHELEWKDRVFCDNSYLRLNDGVCLVRSHCVNHTDVGQTLALHYLASMNFPPPGPYSAEVLRPMHVSLPKGAQWVSAMSYEQLSFARPRPTDNLMPDGLMRGECCGHGFTGRSGLGCGFGADTGDRVRYRIALKENIPLAAAVLRYRMPQGGRIALNITGFSAAGQVVMSGDASFSTVMCQLGNMSAGEYVMTLTSQGGAPVDLDGFAICSAADAAQVTFTEHVYQPRPEILTGPSDHTIILKYADCDHYYGMAWQCDSFAVREFHDSNLDRLMRHTAHNHVSTYFDGDHKAHFTNVFMRPLALAPRSDAVVTGMVCQGKLAIVRSQLERFADYVAKADELFAAGRGKIADPPVTPAGERYRFSQRLMAATTLSNVVYPVYTQQQYIKHYTPGRWWDCLYTWDSGFIGIGLAQHSAARAADCLRAYLTDTDNEHAAFIHHGSMMPMQMFLLQELWNKTQDRALLEYAYPRLRQYYEFFVGRKGSSTFGKMRSGLLSPWDYFYNSGGWDDYPPQHHMHAHHMAQRVTPVITTAMAICSARVLRMASDSLGRQVDVAIFDADIVRLSESLQQAWDEQAGYFSYVVHDDSGAPKEFLRHESGANFNMGLDGASPLVAGACSSSQKETLLAHLKNPGRLLSRIGLSAVDLSAPYYRRDGYWNGAVWFPHQWLFWKTMLDMGEADFAYQIATRGLDLWQNEANESYHCFEHFLIENGRGAGWHQFGGLSTPVMAWYAAYYRPGQLTCGFNAWVKCVEFTDDERVMSAELQLSAGISESCCVIACMNPEYVYECAWDGASIEAKESVPGALNIKLPVGGKAGRLCIRARSKR